MNIPSKPSALDRDNDILSHVYGGQVDAHHQDRYFLHLYDALRIVGKEKQDWANAWLMLEYQEEERRREGADSSSSSLIQLREQLVFWQVQQLFTEEKDHDKVLKQSLHLFDTHGAPSPASRLEYLEMYKRLVTQALGKRQKEGEEGDECAEQRRRGGKEEDDMALLKALRHVLYQVKVQLESSDDENVKKRQESTHHDKVQVCFC